MLFLCYSPSDTRSPWGRNGPACHVPLFRALLSQLHPGRSGTCARARDRKDLRRGPEYRSLTARRTERTWRQSMPTTKLARGCARLSAGKMPHGTHIRATWKGELRSTHPMANPSSATNHSRNTGELDPDIARDRRGLCEIADSPGAGSKPRSQSLPRQSSMQCSTLPS